MAVTQFADLTEQVRKTVINIVIVNFIRIFNILIQEFADTMLGGYIRTPQSSGHNGEEGGKKKTKSV